MINNAAATIGPFKLTVDNLESQISTDHIGPFLFTKLLVPKLVLAAKAKTDARGTYTPRVVAVTSIFHEYARGIDLADMAHPDPAKYEPFAAYNQAKSAGVLCMAELSRRAGGAINGYSVSPGGMRSSLNFSTNVDQRTLIVALTNIQLRPESLHIFVESGTRPCIASLGRRLLRNLFPRDHNRRREAQSREIHLENHSRECRDVCTLSFVPDTAFKLFIYQNSGCGL